MGKYVCDLICDLKSQTLFEKSKQWLVKARSWHDLRVFGGIYIVLAVVFDVHVDGPCMRQAVQAAHNRKPQMKPAIETRHQNLSSKPL